MHQAHSIIGHYPRRCTHLGPLLTAHKTVGLTTCLMFLGMIDTTANMLRLPTKKLEKLKTLLNKWGDRKACSRRELESRMRSGTTWSLLPEEDAQPPEVPTCQEPIRVQHTPEQRIPLGLEVVASICTVLVLCRGTLPVPARCIVHYHVG